MSEDKKYLTKEGLEKITAELHHLKTVRRREISDKIEEAVKLGDISENAEYHEAKDEQGMNEAKIRELEEVFNNAELIANGLGTKKCVSVGCTIEVKIDSTTKKYTIVGPSEANPSQGLISNESPIGQAFLGKKIGESVEVEAPAGLIKYKVLSIQ
ncbi:MAG: transcription elongation factor GreA [Candidatus Parcubacteria bacterium]|nr:transcription elongation factor GreA [Candidatus Parcubacteria bacterium]